MKYIELTKGYKTKVDDKDFDKLNKHSWQVYEDTNTNYAVRHKNNSKVYMHREILGINNINVYGDHKNGDGLDNRKNNLRKCTPRQNSINCSKRRNTTSKYKGVYWSKYHKSWRVYISPKPGKRKFIASSKDEKEAAKLYNKAAKKYYGEFANLNDI